MLVGENKDVGRSLGAGLMLPAPDFMTETADSKLINDWLLLMGNNQNGLPLFQLVWSDDLTEIRKGTIIHYFEGKKVAESEEITRFPKYNYIKERWILEQWQSGYNPELPESINGSYEPIYVFENSKHEVLPLSLTVVQFLVSRIVRPRRSSQLIHSDIELAMKMKEEELDKYTEDSIDCSVTASLLHSRSAGLVPANYDILPPNLRRKLSD